jgi:FkbM family methyltransferase
MLERLKRSIFVRVRHAMKTEAFGLLSHELDVSGMGDVALDTLEVIATIKSYLDCRGQLLVDVGAHKGLFAKPAMQALGFERFIAFEPNQALHPFLRNNTKNLDGEVRGVGLGDAVGKFQLHVHADPSMSSLLRSDNAVLRREFDYYDPDATTTVEVDVSTLDSELKVIIDADKRFFLKVDTQGNELDVLRGGTSSLRKCIGILLEHMFVTPYEGQPVFCDLISFLEAHGFHCVAVLEIKRKKSHRITGVDFLFMPTDAAIKILRT